MMKALWTALAVAFVGNLVHAQLPHEQKTPSFSRADTLRGMWSPERSWYDITYYDLDVRIDPAQQWIGDPTPSDSEWWNPTSGCRSTSSTT